MILSFYEKIIWCVIFFKVMNDVFQYPISNLVIRLCTITWTSLICLCNKFSSYWNLRQICKGLRNYFKSLLSFTLTTWVVVHIGVFNCLLIQHLQIQSMHISLQNQCLDEEFKNSINSSEYFEKQNASLL
jgi:hypothetical protein